MVPTLALREAAMQLLAADTTTLAPVALGNKIALIKENFVPAEDLDMSVLAQADFTGSTPIVLGTGTQAEGLDPATSDSVITLKEPAGGLRWETTDAVNLPQTIYGYILMDNAGAVFYASALLDAPVTLTASNQFVQIGAATLRQLAGSIS